MIALDQRQQTIDTLSDISKLIRSNKTQLALAYTGVMGAYEIKMFTAFHPDAHVDIKQQSLDILREASVVFRNQLDQWGMTLQDVYLPEALKSYIMLVTT